ncbi:DUF6602 domain-containing protein [Acinetobacter baumannii]|uniref:DUF6602 domain-containing protein n=1 Tax=Acinetobacter baumannii TaxID=470 RepID=UPI001230687D|nr:DUF6602 domain-containing protein [Acinetobacter baumannii]
MGIISEKINAKISSLKADFEINRNVVHQGVKGGLNEQELINLIKDVIPSKYKISRGIIENSKNEQSNETDFFIYDDEILPPYIKQDLAFLPIEATRYIFEVKSTINAGELKSTIKKFAKYRNMGGEAPTVMFSFSSDIDGNELERYKKYDDQFLHAPKITVFCISGKGYYFWNTSKKYLKDVIDKKKFFEDLEFSKDLKINIRDVENFNFEKLTINNIKFSDISFKIHQWIGVVGPTNQVELSLLSGISNTLCRESFGSYLLEEEEVSPKIYSICYEDMRGNFSCSKFSKDGIDFNINDVSYSFSSTQDKTTLLFKFKSCTD